LLKLIQEQKRLEPAALFKLAGFFNNSLLNASLGESLEVSALATIVGAPDLKKPIQRLFDVKGFEEEDQIEDRFPFDWPYTPSDEGRSEDVVVGLSFIFGPLFNDGNSGLLVKPHKTEAKEVLYFIVGVCPNPNNLSFHSANGA